MKHILKKILIIFFITFYLTIQSGQIVFAEAPSAPTPPITTETRPEAPDAPTAPEEPQSPTAPQPPTIEEIEQQQENNNDSNSTQDGEDNNSQDQSSIQDSTRDTTTENTDGSPSPEQTTTNKSQTGSQQVGDSEIKTGDATNTALLTTAANNNTEFGSTALGQDPSVSVINSGNGSDSTNSGSAVIDNQNTTTQDNSAVVNNNLDQSTTTGKNTTSDNVGNSSIKSGDANTSGTVITAVNTNVEGIGISEFNINDDQIGDIILDFGAQCILGCGGTTAIAKNTGNGSDSTNTSEIDLSNTNTTFQTNDAVIGNDLILTADSGNNTASRNTGGDSNIATEDANVAANVLTFANNNIAGNVVLGVVNIFGDLIGDIIFPEDEFNTIAKNINNGQDSTNSSTIDIANSNSTFQTNDVDITNNLVFDANTGVNDASRNTGGDSSVTTGDTSIDANVLNVANSNINGGNWWLVLINQAGNWIGKIIGADQGSTYAGSQGTEFQVDPNGVITAVNKGDGSDSSSSANVSQTNTNTTVQTNTAEIENNLNLTANTGGNQSNDNTGGNSTIKTGDANIIANLVNFVNNNIVGNGKLIVTVVNVFGSWVGDFVTPGQKKEQPSTTASNQSQSGENHAIGGSSLPQQIASLVGANTNLLPQPTTSQTNTQGSSSTTNTPSSNTQSTTSNPSINGWAQSSYLTPQTLGFATTLVASAKKNNEFEVVTKGEKSKISINLAWLLVLIPIAGLYIIARKVRIARFLPSE